MLGYEQFLAQLEAGIAAHHAGMVPAFKEAVEACFVEGLTKVVFATETLAVGINMPARTVVIEKLTKFTGDHHEALTAGEYTQLTGRAGGGDRRHRPGGRAVEPVRPVRAGGRAGRQPYVPPALGVPADLQHGGQPRRHLQQRAGPPPAQPLVRPVPGRPRRRPPRGPRGRVRERLAEARQEAESPTATSGRTAGHWTRCEHGAEGATTSSPSGSPASVQVRSSTPRRAAIAGRWR